MNQTDSTSAPASYSAFVPVLLISLAFIFLLSVQFTNASRQRSVLRNAEQSLANLEKSRASMVEQSGAVQRDLERLCSGLLDLAQTDTEAQALVQRFGIGRSGPSQPKQ